MPAPDKLEKEEVVRRFITDKKIVIADPSSISRSSFGSFLSSMGAKMIHVSLFGSFKEAEDAVKKIRPQIIVSEYEMDRRKGLELLELQRFHYPDRKDTLFLLATSNQSQAAAANAFEDDVDCFITKPFTPVSLRATVIPAVYNKLNPSDYMKYVEKGKAAILAQDLKTAESSLLRALALEKNPALACAYLGDVFRAKQDFPTAENQYRMGLSQNPIHYKCLVGLFELYSETKRDADAYSIIKAICENYPSNAARLQAAIRLAVVTGNYDHVDQYYSTFQSNAEAEDSHGRGANKYRDAEAVRYVSTALIIAGKSALKAGKKERGIDLFQKAMTPIGVRAKLLRQVITTLLDLNYNEEADLFFRKYPDDARTSTDYLIVDLLLTERFKSTSLVVSRGREILASGVHDPIVYEIVIKGMAKAGVNRAVEELIDEAGHKYPDKKQHFASLARKS